LSSKYAFVGKDVDVFEHDKLSKFTKIHIKVTEEPLYCCSTFHGLMFVHIRDSIILMCVHIRDSIILMGIHIRDMIRLEIELNFTCHSIVCKPSSQHT
jgi:hypothetical protein